MEKVKTKRHWLLKVFIVLGFVIIGFQLITNIVKMNKHDVRNLDEQEILIDTTQKEPDSKSHEERKDSVWDDTEFMQ